MVASSPDADAVVVGAGLAGLRCAAALTGAGQRVVILDAAGGVGGRVSTDVVDGFVCDRGFQVLNPAYPAVRSWVDLDELALRRFDAGVLVRAAEGLRVVADPIRAPHLAIPMLRSGLLRPGELWHLATWLAPALTRPQASTRGPDATLADALDRAGVTGPLRRVMDRFLAGVLADSHGSSSANFVRLLLRSFSLGRPGIPSGGMQRLPELLARPLRDLRLRTPVRAVHPAQGGRPARVETDSGDLTGRYVVVATDPGTASSLCHLPPVTMRGLTTWWYACDEPPDHRRLLAVDGRGATTPPGPVWNAAVVTAVAPENAPEGRHLVQATTLLDRRDGGAPDGQVRAHLADIYSCDTTRWEVVTRHVVPDALPASGPPLCTRLPQSVGDGVLVCGDHRDTSSIQGALVSGDRAARTITGAEPAGALGR